MSTPTLYSVISRTITNSLADTHTATVAIVTAVNAKTINVRPVLNRVVDGESIELPEFIEVPPIFLQGGGSYIAHPIAIGDYCLLIFAERCFDRWYGGQDFVSPAELRMHDYSDAFALVGINPLSTAIDIPDKTQQIGDTNQEGDYTHTGNREQTGNFTLIGDYDQTGDMTIVGDFELTGDMLVTGNITCTGVISAASFSGLAGGAVASTSNFETTADVKAGSISLKTHTHDYTWTAGGGSGTTDEPN